MALPNKIDKSLPPGTEDRSLGDNRIREFKEALEDIIGLPDNTNITNALFEVLAAGLTVIKLQDKAADPATAGFFQRNGPKLLYHNGVLVTDLLVQPAVQAVPLSVPNAFLINSPAVLLDVTSAEEDLTVLQYGLPNKLEAWWTLNARAFSSIRLIWRTGAITGSITWRVKIWEKKIDDLLGTGSPVKNLTDTTAISGVANKIRETGITLSYTPAAGAKVIIVGIHYDTGTASAELVHAELVP